MICLSVTGRSCTQNLTIIKRELPRIQCVELRADFLVAGEYEAVARFSAAVKELKSTLTTVLTMRSVVDGGNCTLSDTERLAQLFDLLRASLKYTLFDFVDIEFANRRHSIARQMMRWCLQHGVQIICSCHNMDGGTHRLYRYLASIARVGKVIPKVAVHIATSKQQYLFYRQLLRFRRRFSNRSIIAIGMGHAGTITRILAKKFGCFLTYATPSQITADTKESDAAAESTAAETVVASDTTTSLKSIGVLSATELTNRYHYHTHNENTTLFAVIGNPVAHSKSPHIHNQWFAENAHNACYLPLFTDSVRYFFKLARIIALAGASVTIPHKQAVIRYLSSYTDSVKRIKSCNTVIWHNHRSQTTVHRDQHTALPTDRRLTQHNTILHTSEHDMPQGNLQRSSSMARIAGYHTPHGDNTDKQGFLAGLDTLLDTASTPHPINIIGAGGVARTVAVALLERQCPITIANRNTQRAHKLVRVLSRTFSHATIHTVPLAPQHYPALRTFSSVFINTTSVGMAHASNHSPLPDFPFRANDIVYDLIYTPPITPLLKAATVAGARTLNGQLMFDQQARLQYQQFCTVLRQ